MHCYSLSDQNHEQPHPVLFLASTNLPWTLDPAILRRFHKILPVDLPEAPERLEILKLSLKGHDVTGLDLKTLANANTKNFSGN